MTLNAPPIDLTAALNDGLASRRPRGDEAFAHLSDTLCDYQTWLRRSTGQPATVNLTMAMGLAIEAVVLDAATPMLEARGYAVHRNVTVAYDPFLRRTRYVYDAATWDDALEQFGVIGETELIGHPDALLWLKSEARYAGTVEVKTTGYLKRGAPPSDHYVEQAAQYALATGSERFAIFAIDRKSGAVLEQWYDTADYAAWALMRAKEIATRTDPEAYPPEPEPRQSWACAYCDFRQCPRNPKHEEAA